MKRAFLCLLKILGGQVPPVPPGSYVSALVTTMITAMTMMARDSDELISDKLQAKDASNQRIVFGAPGIRL